MSSMAKAINQLFKSGRMAPVAMKAGNIVDKLSKANRNCRLTTQSAMSA